MCLYNRLIKNKRYIPNKKNGGAVPAILDIRTLYVPVACGDCIECKKQKAREWSVRLQQEIKEHKNGKFVTLTFSTKSIVTLYKEAKEKAEIEQWEAVFKGEKGKPIPKGYDLDNAAAGLAIRRFLERWRKKYKKSVRHWLITEIGGNNWEHVHIHGIIFTDENITNIWQYGGVSIGRHLEEYKKDHWVNNQTINYIVKYLYKTDDKHKTFKSKIFASAGIGSGYEKTYNAETNKYDEGKTDEKFKAEDGTELPLPIYYRNKIYTDEEKEKLWIEKLDKAERWVCGEKIIVKTEADYKKYAQLVAYHQHRTRQLGYGSNETWKRKEYEKQQREIMQNTRSESMINKTITHKDAHERQRTLREIQIAEWNKKHG